MVATSMWRLDLARLTRRADYRQLQLPVNKQYAGGTQLSVCRDLPTVGREFLPNIRVER